MLDHRKGDAAEGKELEAPELGPCAICGREPDVKLIEGSGDNPMYVFDVDHLCRGGYRVSHLSLFFQNDSTRESCLESLRASVTFYSGQWNKAFGSSAGPEVLAALRECAKQLRQMQCPAHAALAENALRIATGTKEA